MVKKTRSEFKSITSTLYQDNTTGQISASDLRTQMDNIADTLPFTVSNTRAPNATDDSYNISDIWTDTVTNISYLCISTVANNAVWQPLASKNDTATVFTTEAAMLASSALGLGQIGDVAGRQWKIVSTGSIPLGPTVKVAANGYAVSTSLTQDCTFAEDTRDIAFLRSVHGTSGTKEISYGGHAARLNLLHVSPINETTAGGVGIYIKPGELGFNVLAFSADNTGASDPTDIIKAVVAEAVTRKNKVYFPNGTYRCDGELGTIQCPITGDAFLSSVIQYTGTGTFATFRGNGNTFEGIHLEATNPAHAANFTTCPASSVTFKSVKWTGPAGPASGCLMYANEGIAQKYTDCFFQGHDRQLVGQSDAGTGYCNGMVIENTIFNAYGSYAIGNGGQGWVLNGVIFEHTSGVAAIPNAVKAIGTSAACVWYGLSINGCWFGDNTTSTAHNYIEWRGNGLSIVGSYINGNGPSNCTVVACVGVSDGITITGNYISNFSKIVDAIAATTGVNIESNRERIVATRVQGIYTSIKDVTGVRFPTTPILSTNVNVLDDYKEGTFTPDLHFGDSQVGTFTFTKNNGFFTKVGNVVTFQVFIRWTAKPTGGNLLRVNLPYPLPTTDGSFGYGAFPVAGHEGAFVKLLGNALGLGSQSKMQIMDNTTGGSSASYTVAQIPAAGALAISGTYLSY